MAVNGTFWVVTIPTAIVGGGLSVAFPVVMVSAMAGTPPSDQGLASGLISTSGQPRQNCVSSSRSRGPIIILSFNDVRSDTKILHYSENDLTLPGIHAQGFFLHP
jgi:hypothetical protein